MSEYGLWGYLARAHQAHLRREAALARAARGSGRARNLSAVLHRLLLIAVK